MTHDLSVSCEWCDCVMWLTGMTCGWARRREMSEWFPANSRIACSRQCTSTPLIYKEEQVTTDISCTNNVHHQTSLHSDLPSDVGTSTFRCPSIAIYHQIFHQTLLVMNYWAATREGINGWLSRSHWPGELTEQQVTRSCIRVTIISHKELH